MSERLQIGILVFPRVTQLDFTGPLQVFSSVPDAEVHLIWKRIEPVRSDFVLTVTPTVTFADCPPLDVICVPGGYGTDDLLNDEEVLDFLRSRAERARYITSVCTGSGTRRGRSVERLSRDHPLERHGRLAAVRCDAIARTGLRRSRPDQWRWRHRRHRFRIDIGRETRRSGHRRSDPAPSGI